MPVSTQEIMHLLSDLGEQEGVKVTVTESCKGGLIAMATTAVGGLIMGPIGLFVGGVVGGASAFYSSKGKFQSLGTVIKNMEPSKREILASRVREFLQRHSVHEASGLSKILGSQAMKMILIELAIGIIWKLLGLVIDKLQTKWNEKAPGQKSIEFSHIKVD